MRMFRTTALLAFLGIAMPVGSWAASPFSVDAVMDTRGAAPVIRVDFKVPAGHFLYADDVKIEATGTTLVPISVPDPKTVFDKFSGENKRVYGDDFSSVYRLEAARDPVNVTVSFQGCSETLCFFPESKTFTLSAGQPAGGEAEPGAPRTAQSFDDWKTRLSDFDVAGSESGYLNTDKLLAFLDGSLSGGGKTDDALSQFHRRGALFTVLLILLGGLALNLTPCVLPLIPINLAIIGAGAKAGSKARGFALGGVYGLGMAITYGMLGLVVVLTGSKFGTLNASMWFNAVIAVVFFLLSLAMFDVITIDFTRFQGSTAPGANRKGHFAAVFVMGAVSALLAGACVAPMVIFVLLLAGALYGKGMALGLFLPFLLGLGMALPWPFAGAGLSFLPKPGKWMTWVKYAFGVIILAAATYYGYEAYRIYQADKPAPSSGVEAAPQASDVALAEGLSRALEEGKPVFIDFWATWCKNCIAMDKTTFKDPAVRQRLEGFVEIKYQAEKPNEPPARDVLDHFKVIGLPTYVVLVPKK